ncbi:creatininase family protein, partial [bacterium]|nr:creatininase family protein [bacterium]
MPSHKLEELRYPQLDGFHRETTLFVIAVSPLEEHGPHLPLGVDAFDAEHFSEEITLVFLEKYPEWNVVRIPTLYIGSFLFDAPGSIRVKPRTIRNLLVDTLSSLAKYGFKYFLISNAHGGPTHIVALEEAAATVSRKYGVRAVSYSGHMIWNFFRGPYLEEMKERLQLTDADLEALKQDAHAGEWETSMMLKLRPDLV